MEIGKVAVIGSGVMGSGIAAQVANAGVPVVLLDLATPSDERGRSALAERAIERMAVTEPAPLMHPRNASLITPGNLDDDLALLAGCDWIVEAVVERLDVKQDLYAKIDAVRSAGAVVSSNTSTIPLHQLVDGMPESFRRDFMITHFFNPPRYMRLLEVVDGADTSAESSAAVRAFCDRSLGKGVVECHDTPGFIGNRIGVYWLQCAVAEAMRIGITVEEADAVVGAPAGIPRTGVFGLIDLVGLDLMPHILASLDATLAPDDPFREYFATPPLIEQMIERGQTGRKGSGGFYRLIRRDGKRVKEAIDLKSGEYRVATRPRPSALQAARDGGLRALMSDPEPAGRYARRVLSRTLAYAASLVPEIADDLVAVDDAMKLGYGWREGPFELIDALGAEWLVECLEADGVAIPPLLERARGTGCYRVANGRRQYLGVDGGFHDLRRPDGVLLLEDVKRATSPIASNGSASLWDIGDGVACLEFHSKMNAIDPDILALLSEALERVASDAFRALVVYNEGDNFSAGANLGLALYAANMAAWDQIEQMVRQGQDAYRSVREAPFPVVGAPAGMALGGGCELLLHCDAVVAHAESYVGLVETGVGLVPGWGGCTEMLARWASDPRSAKGPMPPVSKVFETVSVATVARSASLARDHLFLRPDDRIVMNRDRVLAEAKAHALALAPDFSPPEPVELTLPGASGAVALALAVDAFVKRGKATAHDQVVAAALARVLSGGATDLTETVDAQRLRDLERTEFMQLIRHPATLARIEHMLETGRPLRN